ncbi:unnamed protein product, partial [Heterosigma akashiwo]
MLFVEDLKEELKIAVPNGSGAAQQQYISQKWMELPPEHKQKYRDRAQGELLRYQR